jgi:ATP-dependent DNA helicase RecG
VSVGTEQAKCFLVSDFNLEARSRLEILETTNDGFAISLADLKLRGPGEVFGEEQTGIMKLKMANLITDEAILKTALKDAKTLLDSSDPLAQKLVRNCFQKIDSYILD